MRGCHTSHSLCLKTPVVGGLLQPLVRTQPEEPGEVWGSGSLSLGCPCLSLGRSLFHFEANMAVRVKSRKTAYQGDEAEKTKANSVPTPSSSPHIPTFPEEPCRGGKTWAEKGVLPGAPCSCWLPPAQPAARAASSPVGTSSPCFPGGWYFQSATPGRSPLHTPGGPRQLPGAWTTRPPPNSQTEGSSLIPCECRRAALPPDPETPRRCPSPGSPLPWLLSSFCALT